jgi:benzoyl-CoA reductase/2-hydroxyglutaryl-CoA dehydratase subunit BcrC/BadD/HgdB
MAGEERDTAAAATKRVTVTDRERQAGGKHPLPMEPLEPGRLARSYASAVQHTLQRLASVPDRPAAMEPFDDLLGGTWRLEQLAADDRPVVGTLCNFVPEEVVLASGAIPIRLDLGLAAAAEAAERVLPADLCPEVKALVGAHLGRLPYFEHTDLLVIPTACDGKKKLVAGLGEQREVWMMELPQIRDSVRSRELWTAEVKALARRVRKLSGRRLLRRGELGRAIDLLNQRTALARRLNELRWEDPTRLGGRDAFLVMQASFVADPSWWVERTTNLLAELEASRPRRGHDEVVRVLITGSPVLFPDFSLLHLIEESGAVVIADEMCSGTQRLYNPTVIDESTTSGMLRAVADKTLLPCTCPCFVSSDLRVDRILELARRSVARGVIHHTLRLCQLFDLEAPRVAAALKAEGLPMLALHAEYSTEAPAALKNRVEAFVEMLRL